MALPSDGPCDSQAAGSGANLRRSYGQQSSLNSRVGAELRLAYGEAPPEVEANIRFEAPSTNGSVEVTPEVRKEVETLDQGVPAPLEVCTAVSEGTEAYKQAPPEMSRDASVEVTPEVRKEVETLDQEVPAPLLVRSAVSEVTEAYKQAPPDMSRAVSCPNIPRNDDFSRLSNRYLDLEKRLQMLDGSFKLDDASTPVKPAAPATPSKIADSVSSEPQSGVSTAAPTPTQKEKGLQLAPQAEPVGPVSPSSAAIEMPQIAVAPAPAAAASEQSTVVRQQQQLLGDLKSSATDLNTSEQQVSQVVPAIKKQQVSSTSLLSDQEDLPNESPDGSHVAWSLAHTEGTLGKCTGCHAPILHVLSKISPSFNANLQHKRKVDALREARRKEMESQASSQVSLTEPEKDLAEVQADVEAYVEEKNNAKELRSGDLVEVLESFEGNSTGSMQRTVEKGLHGIVHQSDKDGDALIDFFYEGKSGAIFLQWVLRRDFCKMAAVEPTVEDSVCSPPWSDRGNDANVTDVLKVSGRRAEITPRSPGIYYDAKKRKSRPKEDESDDLFGFFACCTTRDRDDELQPVRLVV